MRVGGLGLGWVGLGAGLGGWGVGGEGWGVVERGGVWCLIGSRAGRARGSMVIW